MIWSLSAIVPRRAFTCCKLSPPREASDASGLGARLATSKVEIAARVARQASRSVQISAVPRSVVEADVVVLLTDCDHIFLAADSALARRLINSITHQYLIPNTQVGSKVTVIDRQIADMFSVSRMNSRSG